MSHLASGTEAPRRHLGRVLIVDDDPIIRALCVATLSSEGWTVITARDGNDGIAQMAAPGAQIDCVVSDVNMPGIDGFEFLRSIRMRDDDVPVLFMTAVPTLAGAVQAIDRGAVSYLAKPFAPDALAEAVARASRRHGVARMRKRAASMMNHLGATSGGEISSDERSDLEARFARALAGLWMAFQPIVRTGDGVVVAYEALLRTEEPTLRRPDLFLGVAERLGRIQEVGRVVRAAVARAATMAPPDVRLFVNLHGLELNDEELYAPSAPLTKMASRITLEVTERAALDVVADVTTRVAMLRGLGFKIAVDDLGAGYAGLASLAALEPEIVKIDMSLIRGVENHPTKRRVVGAITTLCRELGSQVVAEGVETDAERASVSAAGVDLIQGYLYGKPVRGF